MIKNHDRFQLKHVSASEWVIHDRAYHENDPRRAVACIWKADPGEYEVTWVRRLPLRRWYESIADILDDVYAAVPRNTKPLPIPHMAPPDANLATV